MSNKDQTVEENLETFLKQDGFPKNFFNETGLIPDLITQKITQP